MTYNVIKSLKWLIFNFPEIENPKDDADKISNCIHWYCQNVLDLINRQKAENESLKVDLAKCSIRLDNLYKTADEIKSEAIKEFAERLKNCFAISGDYLDIINIIDNILKEMTEVETNQRKEDEGNENA